MTGEKGMTVPRATSGVRRRVTLVNLRGLHARAAAKFVRLAERFDAQVFVTRNDETVSGGSIMGLMMLAAATGCDILIEAGGAEAEVAVAALADLVAAGFEED